MNGAFLLTDGVEKSRDNIWFYCVYDKFRIYLSEYGADFYSLVQKPVSTLIVNKNIILGRLQKGIQKYVPDVTVKNIDIGYSRKDRLTYSMVVEYDSIQEDKTTIKDVTFV